MRKDLVLVMIFRHSTTPGTLCTAKERNAVDAQRLDLSEFVDVHQSETNMHTHLVLQAAVLSLCVLPDDHDVHVSVARPHSW